MSRRRRKYTYDVEMTVTVQFKARFFRLAYTTVKVRDNTLPDTLLELRWKMMRDVALQGAFNTFDSMHIQYKGTFAYNLPKGVRSELLTRWYRPPMGLL